MRKVAGAESFKRPYEPPLRVGDIVMLNSGGPPMLVVDVNSRQVVASWRDDGKVLEDTYPRAVLHRCRSLW